MQPVIRHATVPVTWAASQGPEMREQITTTIILLHKVLWFRTGTPKPQLEEHVFPARKHKPPSPSEDPNIAPNPPIPDGKRPRCHGSKAQGREVRLAPRLQRGEAAHLGQGEEGFRCSLEFGA